MIGEMSDLILLLIVDELPLFSLVGKGARGAQKKLGSVDERRWEADDPALILCWTD
jgi:hypothetical protein